MVMCKQVYRLLKHLGHIAYQVLMTLPTHLILEMSIVFYLMTYMLIIWHNFNSTNSWRSSSKMQIQAWSTEKTLLSLQRTITWTLPSSFSLASLMMKMLPKYKLFGLSSLLSDSWWLSDSFLYGANKPRLHQGTVLKLKNLCSQFNLNLNRIISTDHLRILSLSVVLSITANQHQLPKNNCKKKIMKMKRSRMKIDKLNSKNQMNN